MPQRRRRSRRVARPTPLDESVLADDLLPTDLLRRLAKDLDDIAPDASTKAANARLLSVAVAAIAPVQQLYDLVPGVLRGDARAIEEFNTTLDLYDPGPDGHHHPLPPRPGGSGPGTGGFERPGEIPLPEGPGADPCALIAPGKLGAIGVAASMAGRTVGLASGPRIDAVGRVSECLGGIESIGHGFIHGPDVLERRVRTLGHLWKVSADHTPLRRADVRPGVVDLVDGLDGRPVRTLPGEEGFGTPGTGPLGPDGGPGGPRPGDPPPGGRDPDGFPPGFGPDDGPVWCPPIPVDDCEWLRRYCIDLVLDAVRTAPGQLHYAPYTHATGIARISPAVACPGDQVTIEGAGFGASQPDHVDVLIHTAAGCEIVEADAWSDTAITITLPDDVQPGCVGFIDHDLHDEAKAAVAQANNSLQGLNAGLACLRMGGVPELPLPGVGCAPCTDANHLEAGEPVIRGFWADPDTVAPGETITLRWNVDSAETLTVERTSATGPTVNGSTSTAVTGGSLVTSAANHGAPESWTYRLTATNGCGSVDREITVVGSERPALQVDAIEVTQGIQDAAHSVPLVAQKQTVVRATVTHGLAGWGADEVPDVTGRCRIRRNGSWTTWVDPINGTAPPVATPGSSITVVSAPDPANTDDTLNFLLPLGWCTSGSFDVQVEARVDGFGAAGGVGGFDQRVSTTAGPFRFRTRDRLQIRYIRVRHNGTTPTHDDCVETVRRSAQRIPTPGPDIAALPGAATETTTTGDDVEDLLDEMDDAHNCSWWESLWEWLGSDCPDDDGFYWALLTGSFYRGKAAGIPSNTYATPVRTVASTWPDSELVNKAAHELAHCLDQLHLEVCGAQGGESASGWANGGQINEIPFDIETNTTVTENSGIWDLMTYCNSTAEGFRWSSTRRWQQMYDHIGG